MEGWTVREMEQLAGALIAAGGSFYGRRVLQRLQRGEIELAAAVALLNAAPDDPQPTTARRWAAPSGNTSRLSR